VLPMPQGRTPHTDFDTPEKKSAENVHPAQQISPNHGFFCL
jgi:hypothetical protein